MFSTNIYCHFLTVSVQRCGVFLSWLYIFVLVAAGSCWNYFTRHFFFFFFYILNQFSPIDSHIKRTQKKFHVTSANEITIPFILSNQKHAWSLWGCTALAAVSDNQWTQSGNYHKLISVRLWETFHMHPCCGCCCCLGSLPFKFLRTGLRRWAQPRSAVSTEAFLDMFCWKRRADKLAERQRLVIH